MLRARHLASVSLLAVVACGGRADLGEEDAPPVVDVRAGPRAVAAGPLGVCENRIDYGADPGDVTSRSARIGYDADGHWIRYVETLARGGPPLTLARTYDPSGLLVAQEEDLPWIAPRHRHARWTYDDAERPIRIDFTLDDVPPRRETSRLTWGESGELVRLERSTNGAVAAIETWTHPTPDVDEMRSDAYGDGTLDWLWRRRWSGNWLVDVELEHAGVIDGREHYTYSDLARGEVAERTLSVNGADSVDRWSWKDHHVVRSEHEDSALPSDFPQSVDWEWDGNGHPIARTWTTPRWTFRTTIAWDGDRLARVERRDAATNQLLERWSFTWGCPPSGVIAPPSPRIAPIVDYERETTPLMLLVARDRPFTWEVL